MSDLAIKVVGLSKRYRIGVDDPFRSIRKSIIRPAKQIKRAIMGQPPLPPDNLVDTNEYWALKDLSFEVKHGEAIGIIGRNGAGKTTLLKVLSHITNPTEGYAEIYGRLGALLEVGTGFHPELTGRENIYLNATILGMKKDEINRRFDEIVSFAEVERFIDTPVKRYSTGMFARLAFSVAAHLDPEILVVDEVLSVGDIAFQKKSLGKMEGVMRQGRTVLFVSHSIGAIRSFCSRVMLMESGKIIDDGDAASVIDTYMKSVDYGKSDVIDYHDDPQQPIKLLRAEISPDPICPADFVLRCTYRVRGKLPNIMLCVIVRDASEANIFYANDDNFKHPNKRKNGSHTVSLKIPAHLFAPGEYTISYGFWEPAHDPVDFPQSRLWFRVDDRVVTRLSAHNIPWPSVIYEPEPQWEYME